VEPIAKDLQPNYVVVTDPILNVHHPKKEPVTSDKVSSEIPAIEMPAIDSARPKSIFADVDGMKNKGSIRCWDTPIKTASYSNEPIPVVDPKSTRGSPLPALAFACLSCRNVSCCGTSPSSYSGSF
jgi:hypothetical protein